jgi:hypothetical protein
MAANLAGMPPFHPEYLLSRARLQMLRHSRV